MVFLFARCVFSFARSVLPVGERAHIGEHLTDELNQNQEEVNEEDDQRSEMSNVHLKRVWRIKRKNSVPHFRTPIRIRESVDLRDATLFLCSHKSRWIERISGDNLFHSHFVRSERHHFRHEQKEPESEHRSRGVDSFPELQLADDTSDNLERNPVAPFQQVNSNGIPLLIECSHHARDMSNVNTFVNQRLCIPCELRFVQIKTHTHRSL